MRSCVFSCDGADHAYRNNVNGNVFKANKFPRKPRQKPSRPGFQSARILAVGFCGFGYTIAKFHSRLNVDENPKAMTRELCAFALAQIVVCLEIMARLNRRRVCTACFFFGIFSVALCSSPCILHWPLEICLCVLWKNLQLTLWQLFDKPGTHLKWRCDQVRRE